MPGGMGNTDITASGDMFTGAIERRRGGLELADRRHVLPRRDRSEMKPELQGEAAARAAGASRFERWIGGTRIARGRSCALGRGHQPRPARDDRGRLEGFREDLYHRLAVFPIKLPPLRDRRGDLLPIAKALLRRGQGGGGQSWAGA